MKAPARPFLATAVLTGLLFLPGLAQADCDLPWDDDEPWEEPPYAYGPYGPGGYGYPPPGYYDDDDWWEDMPWDDDEPWEDRGYGYGPGYGPNPHAPYRSVYRGYRPPHPGYGPRTYGPPPRYAPAGYYR
ncbi:hypothetical protein [Thiohalorhabdus sp.]|uniref:hypothetical protein n=1 Tax=Thiohalorhabdus sp. TaxID=3094134 RepID=UPI002FC39F44